ncbi:MAG TPA: efflux RND transporter periplasmic adaptor subunit [Gemmatimonadaceae bacterium]|nr:efflux RND transporter periplasmic adaptor subunit [Gemmatimonadaceae bacterium]
MTSRAAVRALTVLSLAAVGACSRGDASEQPPEPPRSTVGAENVTVVRFADVKSGPGLSGTLQAEQEATIRAEIPAAVLGTYAEPGQRVQRGTVLAQLDAAGIRDAVIAARANVATTQASHQNARRDLERTQALVAAGAVAERDLERARTAASAAQAQLAAARAQLSSAEENLSKTRIVAPFAGVVSARQAKGGDVVSPGTALFTVVNPATMRLEASVPASDLSAVRVGLPVEFTVSGYPTRRFVGRIARVSPTADQATGQVQIVATIPNAGATLVGGLFAEGRVATESRTAPMVPASAIDERGLRTSVVRVRGGRVERVDVVVGIRDLITETVEIRSGVAAGDTVLLGAARAITPGTQVTIGTIVDTARTAPRTAPRTVARPATPPAAAPGASSQPTPAPR